MLRPIFAKKTIIGIIILRCLALASILFSAYPPLSAPRDVIQLVPIYPS
jgi:hypothetical protein